MDAGVEGLYSVGVAKYKSINEPNAAVETADQLKHKYTHLMGQESLSLGRIAGRPLEKENMKAKTYKTSCDLPPTVRESMIELLNQHLADTSDLYSQAKQAHWNVKGAQFYQLHELFDKLAAQVEEFADMIAERVTALGGSALGTVRMSASASRLPEYAIDGSGSMAPVQSLVKRFAQLAGSTRTAIDVSATAGDADTADLFTEVSRGLDKSLWFLEAHLQE